MHVYIIKIHTLRLCLYSSKLESFIPKSQVVPNIKSNKASVIEVTKEQLKKRHHLYSEQAYIYIAVLFNFSKFKSSSISIQ